MTRKDYELIARVFRRELSRCETFGEKGVVYRLARELSRELRSENMRFDDTRVLLACGVPL